MVGSVICDKTEHKYRTCTSRTKDAIRFFKLFLKIVCIFEFVSPVAFEWYKYRLKRPRETDNMSFNSWLSINSKLNVKVIFLGKSCVWSHRSPTSPCNCRCSRCEGYFPPRLRAMVRHWRPKVGAILLEEKVSTVSHGLSWGVLQNGQWKLVTMFAIPMRHFWQKLCPRCYTRCYTSRFLV